MGIDVPTIGDLGLTSPNQPYLLEMKYPQELGDVKNWDINPNPWRWEMMEMGWQEKPAGLELENLLV